MFLQLCPVCEHRNPRGSRFCNECGSPLQLRFCPACHAAEDVMSLECRSCGEKLPLVPLTDAAADPADIPPSTESIWKIEAPHAMIGRLDDDAVVTVHGGNAPAPVLESARETAAESAPILEPIAAPRLEPVSATVPDVEPAPIELPPPTVTKKTK